MPRVEDEAWAAAEAAPRDASGEVDLGVFRAEYERGLAERQERLIHEARAAFRAMDGWGLVKSHDDWQETVRQAAEDLDRGKFLVERLGADRHLDPQLMAVLLVLRRRLIDEHDAKTAAELMLIDVAVLSYYHTLRITGWIGNFAMLVESEFFSLASPTVKLKDRYGWEADNIQGLRAEEYLERLREQFFPLLDRCNRMMLRNLKALKGLRDVAGPSLSIGSAGQVNVAQTQTNGVRMPHAAGGLRESAVGPGRTDEPDSRLVK